MSEVCAVCDMPLSTRVIMACGHEDICIECFIRLVKGYQRMECYFCQKPFDSPPVASRRPMKYEDALSASKFENKPLNFRYIEPEIAKEVEDLMLFHCPDCKTATFPDKSNFESHLKSHRKVCCSICWDTGRFLACDIPIFPLPEFAQHKKQHPKCSCCELVAFDLRSLEHHMTECHVRCDVCLKLNRVNWFTNTQELARHYEKEHFICHYPDCCDQGMIAFATRAELIVHLRRVHGEATRDIDLTRDFQGMVSGEDHTRQNIVELNRRFMSRLRSVFGDSPVIGELTREAKALIEGRLTCNEFYDRFSELCGDKKNSLFIDMVAIMPDPQKRALLLRLHENVIARVSPTTMPKSASMPEVGPSMERRGKEKEAEPPMPGRKKKRPKKVVLYVD